MTDIITYIYIISAIGIALVFELTLLSVKLKSRYRSQQTLLCHGYIRQIVKMLFAEEYCEIYPAVTTTRHRKALAEALYIVSSHTYGIRTAPLRELVEKSQLDKFLLHKAKHGSDIESTHSLILLSALPPHKLVATQLQPLLHSHHSHKRIAALLAILAVSPSTAISTLSSAPFLLTTLDIARIIMLLRRGILPIAYEPLLASENRNLQMLGLAIVRNFGIEIADKQLQRIIASSNDCGVTREALYTLSSLGRPLGRVKIRNKIASMPHYCRKELCRHLTHEGYSIAALRTIFGPHEIPHAEALINSYKRNLEAV